MSEEFDSERPHDETWWERELHRNEKLMDKYMAVLGDNPDWDKWENPEDLYNKVHFNIDPPERGAETRKDPEAETEDEAGSEEEQKQFSEDNEFLQEMNEAAE